MEFIELPEPSPEQVEEVARRTAKRIARLLEKAGKSLDPEMADAFEDDFGGLVGGRTPPSPSSGVTPDKEGPRT